MDKDKILDKMKVVDDFPKDKKALLVCATVQSLYDKGISPTDGATVDECSICHVPVWKSKVSPSGMIVVCIDCGLKEIAKTPEDEVEFMVTKKTLNEFAEHTEGKKRN